MYLPHCLQLFCLVSMLFPELYDVGLFMFLMFLKCMMISWELIYKTPVLFKQNKHMLQYFGSMFIFSFSVFLIIP